VDPLRDLGTAVAHQTRSGQTITAGEALTMSEALRSQTLNAAYTGFQERRSVVSKEENWLISLCSGTIR
jgi:predicted amidohydrolase YtcJ